MSTFEPGQVPLKKQHFEPAETGKTAKKRKTGSRKKEQVAGDGKAERVFYKAARSKHPLPSQPSPLAEQNVVRM